MEESRRKSKGKDSSKSKEYQTVKPKKAIRVYSKNAKNGLSVLLDWRDGVRRIFDISDYTKIINFNNGGSSYNDVVNDQNPIIFKKTLPGEQVTSTFHRLVLEDKSLWYNS